MALNFSGKHDVYLEIAERYRQYIRLGVIRYGERLPSVRTAATELGVNPNTIARAYSLLEGEGYIRSLPKKGLYVIWQSNGEAPVMDEECRACLQSLCQKGIPKELLISWIEEVYSEND
ncbi:MAG: GntR family transcriptional regulator [Clostridia bacterium]|nr:GntR family transcriptional regulator [Clostridia bacterium]